MKCFWDAVQRIEIRYERKKRETEGRRKEMIANRPHSTTSGHLEEDLLK